MKQRLVLLGPQRPNPNVRSALDDLEVEGPVVAITAGWRVDEMEVEPLAQGIGRPLSVLPLYAWFDRLKEQEPLLAMAYRARQNRIVAFKNLYRLRVRAALGVVHSLWADESAPAELIEMELVRATEAVRRIDAEALQTADAIRAEYPAVLSRFDIEAVSAARDEAAAILEGASAVLIAGGHVAVLRNRMLFFGVEHVLLRTLLAGHPIVAWGAGAMVLTERIVLFYDDPPEGPSEAEILDPGLGFVAGVTLFPHASKRLRLDKPSRVAAMARRFGSSPCIGLENGAWLVRGSDGWHNRGVPGTATELREDGSVVPLEPPR